MPASDIDLVEFTSAHLDGAWALSQQAKWPHRVEDWAMVLSLSRGVVAVKGGRVVGTAMATLYGSTAATINMVIVDEAMRGCGIGKRLMDFALDASKGRECRLVATQDGLPLYEKLGFRETGRILQHQGTIGAVAKVSGVEWAEDADIAACLALDGVACGMQREALIVWLMKHGRIAVIRRNGQVAGFVALRGFGRGEVAGPVVAENADDAKALLSFVFSGKEGSFLRVDTSEASGLVPWLTEHGLTHAGGGIAMTRDGAIQAAAPAIRTFALASQALG